jgi:hypothetical protein
MPQLNPKALGVFGITLAVAAVGYWGYGAYSKSQTRKVAAALAKDTSQRLRDTLLAEAAGPATTAADAVAKLEAQFAAVERSYAGLRQLDAAALGALGNAADDYVLTSREILRRIAVANRSRFDLGASSQALRSHMSADRGTAAWPGEAVRLRERVDQDYREYRLAAEALVKLLDSLAASQAKIADQLDPSLLIESHVIAAVRTSTLEAAKRIATEVERLTNLAAYR